ncbi:MAG TPA: GatB/YqeY domain-containing protein [Acidimicrobiia bacterium]|nr:GatB/YqeY domain-containing protein [Acidimicrobiia bacterium]
MSIREDLASELRDAMRAQDAPRRDVIRQIETEISVARSEPGFSGELDDDLYRRVISAYVKKMDKTRQEYLDIGERGAAMAAKLGYEVEYLSRWIPQKLDEAQTRDLVKKTIQDLGAAGDEKAAGRVTGQLMKERGKDLDGGLVNRLVREEISAG